MKEGHHTPPVKEEKRERSLIKNIGLGIISGSAILFAILSFSYKPFEIVSSSHIYLFSYQLVIIEGLFCIGLLFLFKGSSHEKSGNYLLYMGVQLILVGFMILEILEFYPLSFVRAFFRNIPPDVYFLLWLYFLYRGFTFGYLSGPLCIFLGILTKRKKDHSHSRDSSLLGFIIYSISILGITYITPLLTVKIHVS